MNYVPINVKKTGEKCLLENTVKASAVLFEKYRPGQIKCLSAPN